MLPPCRAHRRESPCNNQNQETWVCIAKGSRWRPQSPLVASAEAKSSACRKDMPCLQDQQRGRANGQVVSRAAWGALLRKRKVTGRDASLPAPLLAFPFESVARGTVGALPQTPQGADEKGRSPPLDPSARLSWHLYHSSSACLFSYSYPSEVNYALFWF